MYNDDNIFAKKYGSKRHDKRGGGNVGGKDSVEPENYFAKKYGSAHATNADGQSDNYFAKKHAKGKNEQKSDLNMLGGVKDVGKLLYDLPVQTKGALGRAFEDKDTRENVNWADEWAAEATARDKAREEELTPEQREERVLPFKLPFMEEPITRGDIADTSKSTGFSAVAAGSALLGGAAAAPVPVPGARIASGMAASGKAAYNMDRAMFTEELFKAAEQGGKKLTDEERKALLDAHDNDIFRHALWEAGPEAAGNVLGVIPGLKNIAKGVGQKGLAKIGKSLAQLYGVELATETTTQMGQQRAESRTGLSNEKEREWSDPEAWKKSFQEVAPQTFLLSTLMGGGGAAAGAAGELASRKKKDPLSTLPEPADKTIPGEAEENALQQTAEDRLARFNFLADKANGRAGEVALGDGAETGAPGAEPQFLTDQEQQEYQVLKQEFAPQETGAGQPSMGDDVPDFINPQAEPTTEKTLPEETVVKKGVSLAKVKEEYGPEVYKEVFLARKAGKPITIKEAVTKVFGESESPVGRMEQDLQGAATNDLLNDIIDGQEIVQEQDEGKKRRAEFERLKQDKLTAQNQGAGQGEEGRVATQKTSNATDEHVPDTNVGDKPTPEAPERQTPEPKYIQNLSQSRRNTWSKKLKAIDEAKEDQSLEIGKDYESLNHAINDLTGKQDFIKSTDARLSGKSHKASHNASPTELMNSYGEALRIENAIDRFKKDNPAEWEEHQRAQKELDTLQKGDKVNIPVSGSGFVTATIEKKNPKNWRVKPPPYSSAPDWGRMFESQSLLVNKQALRPHQEAGDKGPSEYQVSSNKSATPKAGQGTPKSQQEAGPDIRGQQDDGDSGQKQKDTVEGGKKPWEMSEEEYAHSVGASKPNIEIAPDVSFHQLSQMSEAAKNRRAKDRVKEKRAQREKHNSAISDWKKKILDAYTNGEFKAEDIYDTGAFYVINEEFGDISPFKVHKMGEAERAKHLGGIDKKAMSSSQKETVTQQSNKKTEQKQPISEKEGGGTGEGSNIISGQEGSAETESGKEVSFKWAVVESDDIAASHDHNNFQENKNYPAELQPRRRDNAAYQMQVSKIADDLKPQRLAASYMVSDGAPFVGPDMAVESGNGRTMAIKLAYDRDNAEAYKKWIAKHSNDFGIKEKDVLALSRPMLVRVRTTKMSQAERVRFASDANEAGVAKMSAFETAKTDAQKITSLDGFYPSESGEFDTAANRGFIQRFVQTVVAASEQNGMYTSDGSALSQEGKTRIRNAVFVKAYGTNEKVLSLVVESTNNNIRNITNGMLIAAPKIAKMKSDIAAGKLYDLGISGVFAEVVEDYAKIISSKKTVAYELSQLSVLGDVRTPDHKYMLSFLEENKRSGKKISLFLTEYVDLVYSKGDPRQQSLLGTAPEHSTNKIIESATARVKEARGAAEKQGTLFPRTVEQDGGRSGNLGYADKVSPGSKSKGPGKDAQEVESGQVKEGGVSYETTIDKMGTVRDRTEGKVQGPRQLSLFSAQTVPKKEQRVARRKVFAKTTQYSAGTFKHDGVVETLADVAQVAAPLMNQAQENNIVVMTDDKNVPVAVLRHTVGGTSSAPLQPSIILGVAHSIPSVKNIWFAHNHPSDTARLSPEDKNVEKMLSALSRGSGVSVRGIVAVTPSGEYAGKGVEGESSGEAKKGGKKSVKGISREISEISKQESITDYIALRDWVNKNIPDETGILLMDSQNRPTVFTPLTVKEMQKMRTGEKGTGASAVLADAERTNSTAAAVIVAEKVPQARLKNPIKFLDAHQIKALDTMIASTPGDRGVVLSVLKKDFKTGPEEFEALDDSSGPAWYSRLERTIEAKGPKTAPAAQWLTAIGQWKKKGSIPEPVQEELEWSGLEEYLNAAGDAKITKANIIDFLRENGIKVGEVVSGGKDTSERFREIAEEHFEDQWAEGSEGPWGEWMEESVSDEIDTAWDNEDHKVWSRLEKTRQEYIDDSVGDDIEDGFEDFKDDILNNSDFRFDWDDIFTKEDLETARGEAFSQYIEGIDDPHSPEHEVVQEQVEMESDDNTRHAKYTLPGGENYKEFKITLPHNPKTSERYVNSDHFDEPNIIVHARFDERQDSEGTKVLFVEEIQSDWHQDGRKKGYGSIKPRDIKVEHLPNGKGWRLTYPSGEVKDFYESIASDVEEARQHGADYYNKDAVPDAPFKKAWSMLAMKRMIRYAAENGFDKIAWTTGQQQFERYPEGDSETTEKRLAGMQSFYDKMLPSSVGKFIKKYDGKVENVDVGFGRQPGFTITPKMEESALGEGMPLFSPDQKSTARKGQKQETTLNEILKKARNESGLTGQLAQLLTDFIPGSKLDTKVIIDPAAKSASYKAGETNTITLSDPANAATSLHEIVHAVTVREMDANPEIKERITDLMGQVKKKVVANGLLSKKQLRDIESSGGSKAFKNKFPKGTLSGVENIAYALLNEREFLAQAISSKQFQELLKNTKVVHKGRVRRAWDAFMETVMEVLGIERTKNTAFGEALSIIAELAGMEEINAFAQPESMSLDDAMSKIQNLPAFRRWFGDSKVVDENGEPLVVYHGTVDIFRKFSLKETGKRTGNKYGRGAFFFTSNKNAASAYALPPESEPHPLDKPSVIPVYLSIKNPLVIDAAEGLKAGEGPRSWIGYQGQVAKAQREGYDGVILKNVLDHASSAVAAQEGAIDTYIAFSPTQIKSIFNKGTFDPTNPDINESPETHEAPDSKEWDDTVGEVLDKKSIPKMEEALREKYDSKFLHTILSTSEWIFKNYPATKLLVKRMLERREMKWRMERDITGDYTDEVTGEKYGYARYMRELKKTSKDLYNRINKYLLKTDRTGKGFRLAYKHGFQVFDKDGNVVDVKPTREQAHGLAWAIAIKNNIDRPSTLVGDEKIESWEVVDPKGGVSSKHTLEKEAVRELIEAEKRWLIKKGHGEKFADAVGIFRSMTNRAFDIRVGNWRKIEKAYRDEGLQPPTDEYIDEAERWALVDKTGTVVATFRDEVDARAAGNKNLTLKKQTNDEIRKNLSMAEMIAQIGDLRGTYFPRQRKSGSVAIIASKEGHNTIRENFDFYFSKQGYVDGNGAKVDFKKTNYMLNKLNEGIGRVPLIPSLSKRSRELRRKGYKVEVVRNETMPEVVFDVAKLTASIDAMLREAGKKSGSQEAMDAISGPFTQELAEIVKARGFLSAQIQRKEEYVEGFETDMTRAGLEYAAGTAAGVAKRESAKLMIDAITGRDVSFEDWQKDNPDGTKKEYDDFVDKKRVDPKEQPNLYRESMSFMRESLRNDEQIDRIMGTLKGLAVIKFLGFRISSATVNLTNMIQAVPPTIAKHSGGTIRGAIKDIHHAGRLYLKYKNPKKYGELSEEDRNIFLEITNNGWEVAQFNQENARELQSKVGEKWRQFNEVAMFMFSKVEQFNRAATIFAAYKQLQKNTSYEHAELMDRAYSASNEAHGIYSKETAPAWTRGPGNPLRLMWTFMKFSQNYVNNMFDMTVQGQYKNLAWMLVSPAVLAGSSASLITPLIALLVPGEGDEEEFYKWADENFGAGSFARHGLAGLAGINLKGSLQLNNPMPTSRSEIFGAPGAIVTDTIEGINYIREGQGFKAVEALIPTAFGNAFKAVREGTEGVTTGSYSPVFYGNKPLKATPLDQIVRALSFNPAGLSGIREKQWSEKRVKGAFSERRSKIYEKYKRLMIYGKGDWAEITAEIRHYNDLRMGTRRRDIPPITVKTLRRVLRSAQRPSKTERMRQR